MSTAELIEKIKMLPPEQQKEVEGFVLRLTEQRSAKSFEKASAAVFKKHSKLLRELAKRASHAF
jgi:hypothetical protein